MTQPARQLIGLATGSGHHGIDAVLLELTGIGLNVSAQVRGHFRRLFRPDLKRLLDQIADPTAPIDIRKVSLLNRLLGEVSALAVADLLRESKMEIAGVQAIGSLGPLLALDADDRYPHALRGGSADILAERTGLTVIGKFSARDIAVGGQGMPITALADFLLYREGHRDRVLIHLGGVTSVVFLPADGRLSNVIAFEAGPGNGLLDGIIRYWTEGEEEFDPGGRYAVQGRCREPLLRRWCAHPYLAQRPPKSLPRAMFADDFILEAGRWTHDDGGNLADLLCTTSHWIIECLREGCRRWLPLDGTGCQLIVSGSGTRNGLLWRLLEESFAPSELIKLDTLDTPTEARSAAAAAMLAAMTLDNVAGNSPSITGAHAGRLLGHITPGHSANWAECLRWMARHTAEPEMLRAA